MAKAETRVPCSRETREKLRRLKRGGEAFDDLLREMVRQYDPDGGKAHR